MRKVLSVSVAILALGSAPVLAADMPARPPVAKAPVVAPAPLFNWSGFYYGINAGYAWGTSSHVGGGANSGDFDADGWLLGGTIGANWQNGPWVFGVEGDLAWANADGRGGSAAACGIACSTELNWFGTARVRAGYAVDTYLFYVTGGAAFADVDASQPGGGGGDTRIGWTVGGGVEAAISPNWTAKLEYLYADLGDKNTYSVGATPFNVDYRSHIVRVGLNYKF